MPKLSERTRVVNDFGDGMESLVRERETAQRDFEGTAVPFVGKLGVEHSLLLFGHEIKICRFSKE